MPWRVSATLRPGHTTPVLKNGAPVRPPPARSHTTVSNQAFAAWLQRDAAGGAPPYRAAPPALARAAAVGTASAATLQRTLTIGAGAVDRGLPQFADLLEYYRAERRPSQPTSKTLRRHGLAIALRLKAFQGHEVALLTILQGWAADDVVGADRTFATWSAALMAANRQRAADQAAHDRTPEERERHRRRLDELLGGERERRGTLIEHLITGEDGSRYASVMPEFRRRASISTDLLNLELPEKKDADPLFLPVKRRKLHKEGQANLPGLKVGYRSYGGTISPKANAFVLGEGDQDYGPLLRDLVKRIGVESEGLLTDRAVARLFLEELSGKDAFAVFSRDVQSIAHHIITILFFAEMSRGSIALVSAAAALHTVQSRPEDEAEPGLAESFDTDSTSMRPLFAGKGGAALVRGEVTKHIAPGERLIREIRAYIDIFNYFQAHKREAEELGDFIQRRTLEMTTNLARNTLNPDLAGATATDVPFQYLRSVKPTRGSVAQTLAALGFTHRVQLGDENDCAIYSAYDQLTQRGIALGPVDAFIAHVRLQANFAFGTMIDVLNNGPALLAAIQHFMIANRIVAPALALDVWSATLDGGLMEFQNVTTAAGGAPPVVMTFYFNGLNQFDSLVGGLARA
jgi:hypothetical protein